ncbi:uncharacterized protein LOC122499042 [Leptopilina heterotoma]|uniref:uncharacterized protein LOC122499042 n=1 Tax=Leptopilina heterotoma TaxID=63436 RepID=UPI001CAA3A61|nr:uncharacterized protein LOC122499042 [Leptopilina heterotoma]
MRTFTLICLLISACASNSRKLEKRGFDASKLGFPGHSSYSRTSGYARGLGLGSYATGSTFPLNYAPAFSFVKSRNDFSTSNNLGLSNYALGKNERITGITVNREIRIPVPVPHILPVQVTRTVPIPQPYAIKIERPYPIIVSHPVPVDYPITRTIPVPVPQNVIPISASNSLPLPLSPLSFAPENSYSNSYSTSGSEIATGTTTELKSGIRSTYGSDFDSDLASYVNSGTSSDFSATSHFNSDSGNNFHSGFLSSVSASGTGSNSYSSHGTGTISGFESESYSAIDSGSTLKSGSKTSFGSLLERNSPISGYSYPVPEKKLGF